MKIIHQGAGSALLRISEATVEDKTETSAASRQSPRMPDLLEQDFKDLLTSLPIDDRFSRSVDGRHPLTPLPIRSRATWCLRKGKTTLFISNMIDDDRDASLEQSIANIKKRLELILREEGSSADDIIHTTILLRCMDRLSFATVNAVYAKLFTRPNPPARLTIAIGDSLPEQREIMMSMVIDLQPETSRRSLHVQSRSYWAPANIGPYSQAVSVEQDQTEADAEHDGMRVVYVAGQIPLVPATMDVVQDEGSHRVHLAGYRLQGVLALQHLWRVGRAMEVNWWTAGIAFFTADQAVQAKARMAWEMWKLRHSTDADASVNADLPEREVDVWDQMYEQTGKHGARQTSSDRLPDWSMLTRPTSAAHVPPFWAVQVCELPRACEIEWSAIGVARGRSSIYEGGDDASWMHVWLPADVDVGIGLCPAMLQLTIMNHCGNDQITEILTRAQSLDMPQSTFSWTSLEHVTVYTSRIHELAQEAFNDPAPMLVPCTSVWGPNGQRLAAAVVVRGHVRARQAD